MSDMVHYAQQAIESKLGDSAIKTTKIQAADDLREMHSCAGSGVDSVLTALLNSTVGGFYGKDSNRPTESKIIAEATPADKKEAIKLLIGRLWQLRDMQFETEIVSVLITDLQPFVG